LRKSRLSCYTGAAAHLALEADYVLGIMLHKHILLLLPLLLLLLL
jgi:hypothetical protein